MTAQNNEVIDAQIQQTMNLWLLNSVLHAKTLTVDSVVESWTDNVCWELKAYLEISMKGG